MAKRPYTQRKRAEQVEATRQRIVEATVALHESIGFARTTIQAIAQQAGVQRLTVYRHFRDETELFAACSSLWAQRHPPPDPSQWQAVPDPVARTRTALVALYGYYRHTHRLWVHAYREQEQVPALAAVMERVTAYRTGVRDDLLAAWSPAEPAAPRLAAALAHALEFPTWHSLSRQGLPDAEIAEMIIPWLQALAASPDRWQPASSCWEPPHRHAHNGNDGTERTH